MSQMKAVVEKLLTSVSSAYVPKDYISESILPEVKHPQYTGLLGAFGTQHLRIEQTTLKGGKGQYRRVESHVISTSAFSIDGHGIEDVVTKRDLANYETPFDAKKAVMMGLTTKLWLEKEKALADVLSDSTVITRGTTLSGEAQFSDSLNSNPLSVFNTARESVYDGSGAAPDTAIMDWKTRNKIRFHPQMLDSLGFKDNRPGGLKDAELAEAMDVKRVLIGSAQYESANKGQTSSLSPVWGKNIVFGVFPDKAALEQISGGYMIRLVGGMPRKVYTYEISNPPETTAVLVEDEYDMLITNVGAIYLIKNAIA